MPSSLPQIFEESVRKLGRKVANDSTHTLHMSPLVSLLIFVSVHLSLGYFALLCSVVERVTCVRDELSECVYKPGACRQKQTCACRLRVCSFTLRDRGRCGKCQLPVCALKLFSLYLFLFA
ncbi:hypothetical protein WMY93_003969 [Mugilogobius chulae]|uniref:Uncharacterized protein n=1 Tax=Mugilogobius chulae TaxID=88201 RepID=A0AAW0PYL2_9GOBI